MTITIDKFGRILIPKSIRKELGLEPGNSIDLIVNDEKKGIFLQPKIELVPVLKVDAMGIPSFSFGVAEPITIDFVKAIKEGRDEQDNKIMGV